jgi:hypothetical protein
MKLYKACAKANIGLLPRDLDTTSTQSRINRIASQPPNQDPITPQDAISILH